MARKKGGGSLLFVLLAIGWVVSKCGGSDTDKPPPALPTPPPIAMVEPIQSAETMYVDVPALNQRAAPNGPVVGKLTGGDMVTIYEKRGEWARVSPDNSPSLWVSQSRLCADSGCYKARPKRIKNSDPINRSRFNNSDSACPCSGNRVCIGPRGGRYCITSGGNKRYGV